MKKKKHIIHSTWIGAMGAVIQMKNTDKGDAFLKIYQLKVFKNLLILHFLKIFFLDDIKFITLVKINFQIEVLILKIKQLNVVCLLTCTEG